MRKKYDVLAKTRVHTSTSFHGPARAWWALVCRIPRSHLGMILRPPRALERFGRRGNNPIRSTIVPADSNGGSADLLTRFSPLRPSSNFGETTSLATILRFTYPSPTTTHLIACILDIWSRP